MQKMHKIMEDNLMNQEVFAGQWKKMRGELKSWWGKLADDDLEKIGGRKDKLIGVVQEKYGYAREQAQQEVEQHLKEYGDKTGGPNASGKQDAAEAGAGGPANAPHEGALATAVAAVAGGLESAEGALATGWESAQGALATAATAVAGGLESTSSYLQEKEFAEMATDLTALMRRYPVQTLLVGVGLGYVLARLTKG
jgi:uncharacterized protein YjbJ (UPF0337 family)